MDRLHFYLALVLVVAPIVMGASCEDELPPVSEDQRAYLSDGFELLECLAQSPELSGTLTHPGHDHEGEFLPAVIGETDATIAADCLFDRLLSGNLTVVDFGTLSEQCRGIVDACVVGGISEATCGGELWLSEDFVDDDLTLLSRSGGRLAVGAYHESIHTAQRTWGAECRVRDSFPYREVEAYEHQSKFGAWLVSFLNELATDGPGPECGSLDEITSVNVPPCLAAYLADHYGYTDTSTPVPLDVCAALTDFRGGVAFQNNNTIVGDTGLEAYHALTTDCLTSETMPIVIDSEDDPSMRFSAYYAEDPQVYQFQIDEISGAETLVGTTLTSLDRIHELRVERDATGLEIWLFRGCRG